MRKLSLQTIKERLVSGIKDEFVQAGFSKAVIGLSGGIDSALAAFLVAEAIGAENLICVKMPYKSSSAASIVDADLVLNKLGINGITVDITPAVDAFIGLTGAGDSTLRLGNVMARCRMITLFDVSARENALVIGTSNKTELLLGYGTLWGDLASIINPLGRLFKSEVRALSRFVGVPEPVITKAPSADLSEGQTDEGDFGFTYDEADAVLNGIYEEHRSEMEMENDGLSFNVIKNVLTRAKNSVFKSRVPIIIEFSRLDKSTDYE